MARTKEHRVVNEGRTGRIIARRALRAGLGNPKKRKRDLAELLFEMFMKGVQQGKTLENVRITYATAGMDYPEGSYVESESVEDVVPDNSIIGAGPVSNFDNYEGPPVIAGPSRYVSPDRGRTHYPDTNDIYK